jgi:hypothetical protein
MDDIDNMTPRKGLEFLLAAYEGKPHWVGYPDILRKAIAALDAAEADKAAAVEAERERCARKRVFAPPEAPRGLDYYTFKRGWDAGITAKNAALRTGAKP